MSTVYTNHAMHKQINSKEEDIKNNEKKSCPMVFK